MKLYVIRHSVRETPDDFSEAEEGDPDAELTPEGEEIAKALGDWMAENDEIPSILIASPTVRTHQTAERIVEAIEGAGFAAPAIKTDVSVGPNQSVRGLIRRLSDDDSQKRIGIVSHRGPIVNGLKALALDNGEQIKIDDPAMGELRILNVKRGSRRWTEEMRIRPSDLGLSDHYG